MRVLVLVVAAAFASGCTSVKMVQREGCWVKRTEKIFGRVREEVGPCTREQPKWVSDQLTRLVQECVAQADYRWHSRALDAWSRSRPYPAQPPQEETLRTCMEEARVGLVSENEDLKRRLTEVAGDRDEARTLAGKERTLAEQERTRFQESVDRSLSRLHDAHDKLAEHLGEAATKPAAPAVATATATSTSDGKAMNESGATLASESGSTSAAREDPVTVSAAVPEAPAAPAAAPVAPAPDPGPTTTTAPRRAKIARARRPPVAQAFPSAACAPPEKTADAPCAVDAGAPKPDAVRP